eukprot:IDg15720t1
MNINVSSCYTSPVTATPSQVVVRSPEDFCFAVQCAAAAVSFFLYIGRRPCATRRCSSCNGRAWYAVARQDVGAQSSSYIWHPKINSTSLHPSVPRNRDDNTAADHEEAWGCIATEKNATSTFSSPMISLQGLHKRYSLVHISPAVQSRSAFFTTRSQKVHSVVRFNKLLTPGACQHGVSSWKKRSEGFVLVLSLASSFINLFNTTVPNQA